MAQDIPIVTLNCLSHGWCLTLFSYYMRGTKQQEYVANMNILCFISLLNFVYSLTFCISQLSRKFLVPLKFKNESRSVMSDSFQPHGLYSPWNSPAQKTGVGSLSLLQGIVPTQGWNPGLPHCRLILYQLSHKGQGKEVKINPSRSAAALWAGWRTGVGERPPEGIGPLRAPVDWPPGPASRLFPQPVQVPTWWQAQRTSYHLEGCRCWNSQECLYRFYVLFQVGRGPAWHLGKLRIQAAPCFSPPFLQKMPRGPSTREAPSRAGEYKINRNGGLAGSPWGLTN